MVLSDDEVEAFSSGAGLVSPAKRGRGGEEGKRKKRKG